MTLVLLLTGTFFFGGCVAFDFDVDVVVDDADADDGDDAADEAADDDNDDTTSKGLLSILAFHEAKGLVGRKGRMKGKKEGRIAAVE